MRYSNNKIIVKVAQAYIYQQFLQDQIMARSHTQLDIIEYYSQNFKGKHLMSKGMETIDMIKLTYLRTIYMSLQKR